MPKTLILIFHPDFSHSRANRALADAASTIADTEIFDVQSAYPDCKIDVDAEVERLLGADSIVLQFPIQWYSAPPILQAWQNAVLTRMYYINYETEGRVLEGKPLMIAVTAGNAASAYSRHGANLLPLGEILNPLRVTWAWLRPRPASPRCSGGWRFGPGRGIGRRPPVRGMPRSSP